MYTVKSGDTLLSIARIYKLSLQDILALNPQISDPNLIFPGQEINVSVDAGKDFGDIKLMLPNLAEHQLNPSNYQRFNCPILGSITVTGGFMEPHGHSRKGVLRAIFADGQIKSLQPSNRNIGIDYVVADGRAIAWYSGRCTRQGREGGYGRRVHVKLDKKYVHMGREYDVYQAYAHLKEIWVKQGQQIDQGQQIGVMGGSGHGENDYPLHIDLASYIYIDNVTVQINPQLLNV